MNARNAKDYLPIVQALANGKIIQCNDRGEWVDVDTLYTDCYGPHEYRIKPEPRTFEIWLAPHGAMYPISHKKHPTWKRITVQEVI